MIMIGIYKITKKSNGKSYVGQSNDINRRFDEHKYKKELAIDQAI
jgi:predicted GIY-YIG superfamily endonuclease